MFKKRAPRQFGVSTLIPDGDEDDMPPSAKPPSAKPPTMRGPKAPKGRRPKLANVPPLKGLGRI